MAVNSSLTITGRAKEVIVASTPGGAHGSMMPGLIWITNDSETTKRWIVCAYDKVRVHTKGFPGEIIEASGIELVVVQRNTRELIKDMTLDYQNEQFILRESGFETDLGS